MMEKSMKFSIVLIFLLGIFFISQFLWTNNGKVKETPWERFPQNSMERYAYSKALINETTLEEELLKEENSRLSLTADEYIDYKTQSVPTESIPTDFGTLHPVISTEVKVVVSRKTGKVVRVEDIGTPHVSVGNDDVTWQGGDFTIDRTGDRDIRLSSTGQFFVHDHSVSVGLDIVSPKNFVRRTKVMTISCHLGW